MPYHIAEGRGGGAEVQAWFLARELAGRGFRVSYICQSVKGRAGTIESMDGATLHWIRPAYRFRWMNAAAYYRALSRADADIVVQRVTAFTTGVAALWARVHRRKFVWICTDNASPVKWFFVRQQRALNRSARINLVKRTVLLVDALVTDLARNWGMKRVAMAFTQNDAQRALLKEHFGLDSHRMISGHPVPDRFLPVCARLERPIVLWAGNLGANKRPQQFVQLARMAGSSSMRFVMIGGHPKKSLLAQLFSDTPANLEWFGRVSFNEALAWFDRAAFFVNTSKSEGFPNTFIQAWLRGVPVLSLEADPDGVIAANELGLVSGDLSVMLDYMERLARDLDAYTALSCRIREYAAANMSTHRMASNFIDKLGAACR